MWSERRFFSICHVVGIATLAVVTGSLFWFWMHEPVASGELRAVYIIEIALSFIGALRGMLGPVRLPHTFRDEGRIARPLIIRCAVYLAISLFAAVAMLLNCSVVREPVTLIRSVTFAGLPVIPLSIIVAVGSYVSGRALTARMFRWRSASGDTHDGSDEMRGTSPSLAGVTAILLGLALMLAVFDAESLRRHAGNAPWILGVVGAFGYETVLWCSRGLSERDLRWSSFIATCGVAAVLAVLGAVSPRLAGMPQGASLVPVACMAAWAVFAIWRRPARSVAKLSEAPGSFAASAGPEAFESYDLDGFGWAESERSAVEATLRGLTSSEAARSLGVRPATVRSYLQRAYRKADVGSFSELRDLLARDARAGTPEGCPAPAASEIRTGRRGGRPADLATASFPYAIMLIVLTCFSPQGLGLIEGATGVLGFACGVLIGAAFRAAGRRGAHTVLGAAMTVGSLCILGTKALSMFDVIRPASLPEGVWTPVTFIACALLGVAMWRYVYGLLRIESRGVARPSCFARKRFAALSIVSVAFAASQLSNVVWAVMFLAASLLVATDAVVLLHSEGCAMSDSPSCPDERLPSCMDVTFPGFLSLLFFGVALTELTGHFFERVSMPLAFLFPIVLLCCSMALCMRGVRQGLRGSGAMACVCAIAMGVALWAGAGSYGSIDVNRTLHAVLFTVLALWTGLLGDGSRTDGPLAWGGWLLPFASGAVLGAFMDPLMLVQAGIRLDGQVVSVNSVLDFAFAATLQAMGCVSAIRLAVLGAKGLKGDDMGGADRDLFAGKRRDLVYHYLKSRRLSDLEASVAIEVACGLSTRDIADKLFYSFGSVKEARFSAYRKLGIHSKGELAEMIARHLGVESDAGV